jgi:hypothetical protein
VVADREDAVAERDLDNAAVGAPGTCIVDDIGHRPRHPLRGVEDHGRFDIHLKPQCWGSAAGPVDRVLNDLIQVHGLNPFGGHRSTGQLKNIGYKLGQLVQLVDDRPLELSAFLLG